MVLSGATVDEDGDSLAKFNGVYKATGRKANGYPLFVQAYATPKGDSHYLYREQTSGRWFVTDNIKEIKEGDGYITSVEPGELPMNLTWDEAGVQVDVWTAVRLGTRWVPPAPSACI